MEDHLRPILDIAFWYRQLAETLLIHSPETEQIKAGDWPPLSELIKNLIFTSLDADCMTANDAANSWTQRRLSRQNLVNTFLLALLITAMAHGKGDE
jgi:hypothetical protein